MVLLSIITELPIVARFLKFKKQERSAYYKVLHYGNQDFNTLKCYCYRLNTTGSRNVEER